MAHSLIQLSRRVFNTPQLITMPNMTLIADFLNDRNSGISLQVNAPKEQEDDEDYKGWDDPTYYDDYGIGVIPICGVLTNVPFYGACGIEGVSYTSIIDNFFYLIDKGATTVVLDINSGGGEAYACFESAIYCKKLAKDNNIKIITYVDGMAASAAYAWAAIADEIVMNPMAEVGSIGVVIQLQNINRMKTEMGIDTTYLYAGANKIPFDKEGGFTETFLSEMQDKIDYLYEVFVEFVAEMRDVTTEVVRSTEASTYMPEQAIKIGLADSMMTKEEFTDYVFSQSTLTDQLIHNRV